MKKANYRSNCSADISCVKFISDVLKGVVAVFVATWILSMVPVSASPATAPIVQAIEPNGMVMVSPDVSRVYNVALWSDQGGQDDLTWTVSGSTSYPVYSEYGWYTIHVYTKDMEWVGACRFNHQLPLPAEPSISKDEAGPQLTFSAEDGKIILNGEGLIPGEVLETGLVNPEDGRSVPLIGSAADENGNVTAYLGDRFGESFQVRRITERNCSVIARAVVSKAYETPVVIIETAGEIKISGIPAGRADYVTASVLSQEGGPSEILTDIGGGVFAGNVGDLDSIDSFSVEFDAVKQSDGAEASCTRIGVMNLAWGDALGDPYPGYFVSASPAGSSSVEITVEDAPCAGYRITRIDPIKGEEVPVSVFRQDTSEVVNTAKASVPVYTGGTANYNVYRISLAGDPELIAEVIASDEAEKVTAITIFGGSITVRGADTATDWVDLQVLDGDGRCVEKVPLSRTAEGVFHTWYIPKEATGLSFTLGSASPSDPSTGMAGAVALYSIGIAPAHLF